MYATSETKFHVRSRGISGISRWSSLVCLFEINGRESGVLDGLWRFVSIETERYFPDINEMDLRGGVVALESTS